MRTFRLTIFALFFFLTFVFNIERLDFTVDNAINIETFVYSMVIFIVVITLAFRSIVTTNIAIAYLIWLGVYGLIKYFINLGQSTILGGVYTYLTITEIVFIMTAITLSYWLAIQVYDIEETVKNIMFSEKKTRMVREDAAEEEVKREMYRSRRLNRPLSVIVIEPSKDIEDVVINQTVEDVYHSLKQHYVVISLARGMDILLRRTDLLIEQFKRGRLILLSSETNREEAEILIQRIKEKVGEELDFKIYAGIASFPEDALTYGELVSHAELLLESERSSTNILKSPSKSPIS